MPSKGLFRSGPCRSLKTATAMVHCKQDNGLIKLNRRPLEMIEPGVLQDKLLELVLLEKEQYAGMDIHICVKGGHVAQIYIICQSTSKALGLLPEIGGSSKKEIKDILIQYDQTLLVADTHCCESKNFRGPGAHAGY